MPLAAMAMVWEPQTSIIAVSRPVLAAAFAANGQVLQCRRPDPKNRGWQSDMALLIQRRARAKGVDLAADAVDLLVGVLGTDTIPLDGELEKLCSLEFHFKEVENRFQQLGI